MKVKAKKALKKVAGPKSKKPVKSLKEQLKSAPKRRK